MIINPIENICLTYSSYRNIINLNEVQTVYLKPNWCVYGEYYNVYAQEIDVIMEEKGIYECFLDFYPPPSSNYNTGEILLLPNHNFYYNEFTMRSIYRNQAEFNSTASTKNAFVIG